MFQILSVFIFVHQVIFECALDNKRRNQLWEHDSRSILNELADSEIEQVAMVR